MRALALAAILLAASALVPGALAAAPGPWLGGCAPPVLPRLATPCVEVTLVQKLADLISPDPNSPPVASVRVVTGDFVVHAAGREAFRGTLALAQANGAPDPAVLDRDLGAAATSFEPQATQTLVVAPAPTAAVAELWLAYVEVRLSEQVHYVVLAPVAVPVFSFG